MTVKSAPVARVDHPNLWDALAAFQTELPIIEKAQSAKIPTKTGPGFSYDYADLSDVTSKVLPLLGKHGLSWTCTTMLMDSGPFVMEYRLTHASNSEESISGWYPLPATNTPPQAMGSAITYARRYCLLMVTGVAPGGEDDGGAAIQTQATPVQQQQAPGAQPAFPPQLTETSWNMLRRLSVDLKYSAEKTLEVAKFLGFTGNDLRAMDQGTVDSVISFMLDKMSETETVGASGQ